MNLSRGQIQTILEIGIASGIFMGLSDEGATFLTARNTTISANAVADAATKKAEEIMKDLDEVLKCKKDET